MENTTKCLSLVCALALGAAAVLPAQATTYYARQYYSSWKRYPSRSYYYRTYYYKPAPTYTSYKYHYVIYYPSRPQYAYYYNPYKKVYWGRLVVQGEGQGQYSLLAEKDRKGNLEEIPESAFPTPGSLPPVPEAEDGTRMELPPEDVPTLPR